MKPLRTCQYEGLWNREGSNNGQRTVNLIVSKRYEGPEYSEIIIIPTDFSIDIPWYDYPLSYESRRLVPPAIMIIRYLDIVLFNQRTENNNFFRKVILRVVIGILIGDTFITENQSIEP